MSETTIPRDRLGAVVLCGGRSRRMGRPKAWLPFGDEVLLERVVRILDSVAGTIVVVAAPDQDVPPVTANVHLVRDPVADLGPLQGIAAGLASLPNAVEFAYASATDVPFLNRRWVKFLCERIGSADLAIPRAEGFVHPLAALYRRDKARAAAESLLANDVRRPAALIDVLNTVVLEEVELRSVDPELLTLRNLNTPQDYEAALRLLTDTADRSHG